MVEKYTGYKQHLNYASLRAIECRRAIARSANTGISAFIDSKGLITNATKWDEEIVIKSRLETNSIQTFMSDSATISVEYLLLLQ